ncbi:hypothetical protein pVa21_070 [Vibrio phage pVa-21]|nr:hypothetical protein pVa21_070 [Vibrio phage pVa-21]
MGYEVKKLRRGSFLVYFTYLKGKNGPRVDFIKYHIRSNKKNNAHRFFRGKFEDILKKYVKEEQPALGKRHKCIIRVYETDEGVHVSGFPIQHPADPWPPEQLIKFRTIY